MDVVFITTTADNLDNVDIIDGQIIAVRNAPGYYYDHNSTRYKVGGINIVESLPAPNMVAPGDDSIYLLKVSNSGYSPGVYQINDAHDNWICIASEQTVYDVPDNGIQYMKIHGGWTEPFATIFCTNAGADTARINFAIQAFYNSNKSAGIVKVVGNWAMTEDILVNTTRPNKRLTLDFSSAILTDARYAYTGIIIQYNVTGESRDSGSVHIVGLDGQRFMYHAISASTPQPVYIEQCRFEHSPRISETDPQITFTGSSSKAIIRDTEFYFSHGWDVQPDVPAILIPGSSTAVISRCSFISAEPESVEFTAVKVNAILDDLTYQMLTFNDNILSRGVKVRDQSAYAMDTSMNNTILP